MLNVVPFPTSDWTSIRPSWCSTISLQIASPRPVPFVSPLRAVPLVVKKGWKILGKSLSGMPGPVSIIWMRVSSFSTSLRPDSDRPAPAQ